MDFYDEDYASSRFRKAIMLYKDVPVLCNHVTAEAKKQFYGHFTPLSDIFKADGQKVELIDIMDPQLNYSRLRLGFINIGGEVQVVSRMPRRMWKVGLVQENLQYLWITSEGRLENAGHLDGEAYFKTLDQCLRGDYPNLAAALKKVSKPEGRAKKKVTSVAFDKEFAVRWQSRQPGPTLLHKFHGIVGKLEGDVPILNDNFFFLKETLDKAVA